MPKQITIQEIFLYLAFLFTILINSVFALLKWSYLIVVLFLDVDSLNASLSDIKTKSDSLKKSGTDLKSKFDGIKNDLQAAKADCSGDLNCESFIEGVKNKIKMDVDFNNLPDIQTSIDEIKEVQDKDLAQQVQTVCNKSFFKNV